MALPTKRMPVITDSQTPDATEVPVPAVPSEDTETSEVFTPEPSTAESLDIFTDKPASTVDVLSALEESDRLEREALRKELADEKSVFAAAVGTADPEKVEELAARQAEIFARTKKHWLRTQGATPNDDVEVLVKRTAWIGTAVASGIVALISFVVLVLLGGPS